MSRGHRRLPWAATTVPEMRRQWCNALEAMVDGHERTIDQITESNVQAAARSRRVIGNAAAGLAQLRDEVTAIRTSELYWVARDMVDVAVEAAGSLPAWSPGLVLPTERGVLCWAKPADHLPWTADSQTDVPWDAVSWWTRSDGLLQIQPLSRLSVHPELLEPFGVGHPPLWAAATTILVDPSMPRTDEETGAPTASRWLSIVGAAWLLMGQPAIATRRTIEDSRTGQPSAPPVALSEHTLSSPSAVSIIELRRPAKPGANQQGSDRRYRRRWWVEGHWRQQPCGPGRSQRRPTWIAPYVKGPDEAPLTRERVMVWRR